MRPNPASLRHSANRPTGLPDYLKRRPAYPLQKIIAVNKRLLAAACLFWFAFAGAQNKTIDSLQSVLPTQKEDTNRVNTLLQLSAQFRKQSKIEMSVRYSNEALALAEKLHFKTGQGRVHRELGFAYTVQDPAASLKHHQLSVQCFQEANNKTGIAYSTYYIGLHYQNQRNYSEALKHYIDASEKFEAVKEKRSAGECYRLIGNLFRAQQNSPEAIKYYYKAYGIYEALQDKAGMAGCLAILGGTHQLKADFQGAIANYRRSLSLWEATGNKYQFVIVSNNLANAHHMQQRYKEALEIYRRALPAVAASGNPDQLVELATGGMALEYGELGALAVAAGDETTGKKYFDSSLQAHRIAIPAAERVNNKYSLANNYWCLGTLYTKMRNYDLAREYLEKSLAISTSIKFEMTMTLSHEELAKLDSITGNYRGAYSHYKAYMELRDSAFINDSVMRRLSEAKGRYEFVKREDSLQFSQQLTAEKLKRQQLLAIQQRQQLQIKEAALQLSNQQKELNRLAFLNTETQLQAEQSQRQEKEKQLALAEKEKALQQARLKGQSAELNLKEKEVAAKKLERNALIGAAVAVLLVGLVLYRNKQQKQRLKSLLEKQQLRTQIAGDLHDEIGSTLTSISFYSEAVKMQLPQGNPAAGHLLNKIGANARTVVDAMRDIVWVINPANDVSESLVARMKAHAAEVCSDRNIRCRFEAEDSTVAKLEPEQRKNIYLIYKEAVHNAVKYADCNEITVRFSRKDGFLHLQVQDNGTGFDQNAVQEGNGLANMKRRAEEIGAGFRLDSAAGRGTCVDLTLKIT